MSKPTFSDPPEAIVHDDPEAVPTKNAATVENPAFANPARRLGEMKASSFWLLFGLICILVIGVTVGGAVGGSIAASKNHHTETVTQSLIPSGTSTQSFSATLSTSSTSSLPSQPTVTPTSDCVTTNGTTYSSLFLSGDEEIVPPNAGLKFTKLCGTKQVGFNLAFAYVPTFEACIELCASLNFWNQNKNCLSATYKVTSPMPGNCWASNITNSKVDSDYDSAVLVT
ncbi:hypothetical protein L207DRAFT_534262 [Hyaloscypha variabilis F]|uniref:Apple domain-containing protein n=1 Tax=Hyaloscypha variabilis (strain UAMH 11265 / GT02V1 / F) TaxID=1149755 RepID=A0A2J6R903_HYAVF|nr:hypothetical protein L207DRAFT_534262 [Hyaloscypha variabilis F]